MKKKKIDNYVLNLEEVLGEGSFGMVHKGINEVDQSPVAIKVLSKKLIDEDQSSKSAYVAEIKIMRKLHSKNIVEFKDVIETEHNYYIIQQFCNGGDLRSKLSRQKSFGEKIATEYLSQLLNGCIELLTHGIIHRDMKPENILIHNDLIKIADFGFAKNILWKSQLVKTQVGTPLYMSPELLSRQKYTSKCDIWALGLVYYEMLYGRIPWNTKSEYQHMQAILKVSPKFPKQPPISENAKSFIQGCLKITEADRFTWVQVYNHPLFEGKFKQFISNHDRLERKAKQIINQLRLAVHTQDLDLQNLFNQMKFVAESLIKKPELFDIVKQIDKSITEDEFQFLWDKLDTGKLGHVQFQRFKNHLMENGVRLKSNKSVKGKSQIITTGKSEKDEKVEQVIAKIKSKIEMHKLNLETVFSSYTKSKQVDLNFEMFSRFVLKIEPTLTEHEIKCCFDAFDINHDGRITFSEFSKTIKAVKK